MLLTKTKQKFIIIIIIYDFYKKVMMLLYKSYITVNQ